MYVYMFHLATCRFYEMNRKGSNIEVVSKF